MTGWQGFRVEGLEVTGHLFQRHDAAGRLLARPVHDAVGALADAIEPLELLHAAALLQHGHAPARQQIHEHSLCLLELGGWYVFIRTAAIM